ncbi:hypothetical protein [Amycolatopsis echigonensis]|uniref:Uncharacterized protein n=1 Tax=Amycolatopsis echigonensis TaxID=2576905 RepID=A0A8E1W1T9_9PSEU|nr:hypothetical protein [Amycolatopsis echigonensis]MBB2502174.1 hypothetical protein [Amycolatopsis echigonensis]
MTAELNHRERATLRAVAEGHAEISCSCEPDLFVDGLSCCDQGTVRDLVRKGLIEPAEDGACGERVPAVLTEAGARALGGKPVAA